MNVKPRVGGGEAEVLTLCILIICLQRGLKLFSLLRDTNSKSIHSVSRYIFCGRYTVKDTTVDLLRFNTLVFTKTAFLALKR